MPSTYYVAWWNLENLFDEENSPLRTEKLQRTIGADLVGWTPARRDRKISQLASVIGQMNGGAGPDMLGVCEVENRNVLDLLVAAVNTPLPNRTYNIVHADTSDARGIDVAFIYDDDLFDAPPAEVFFHVVMKRHATREIVQVNFQTHKDRTWSIFGNHWPSRSGGQFESEGYRDIAGETLGYFHQRALEVHGADTPALAMGDFNDEPFNTSLVTHALSAKGSWTRTTRCSGTSAGRSSVTRRTGASTSTTNPTCSTSSWSTRTWPTKRPDPGQSRDSGDLALPRHLHRQIQATKAIRRDGQTG